MNTIVNGFYVLVSRAFGRYSAAHLIIFLQNVIDQVIGKIPFAGLKPTPAEAQASLDGLKTKNMAAINRGKMEMVARDLAWDGMLLIGRQWAGQVDVMCEGDLNTLLSSGFEARRAPTAPATPPVPTHVRTAYNKQTNALIVRCKGDRNSRNYSSQYGGSSSGPWTDGPLSTKASNIEFPGLTAGTMYWFRLRANGAKGSSAWTAPTCKMAL